MTEIEVFRVGTHTAKSGLTLVFTESDLKACAQAYDPSEHEAPLVVGHPEEDTAPAYGWVKSLAYRDGALFAEPTQVDAAFAEIVNAGRYKKISSAFFMPRATGNPVPGALYLRHVGFLGAVAPAVKGMRDAAFAGNGDGVLEFSGFGDNPGGRTLEFRERAVAERERRVAREESGRFLDAMVSEARLPVGLKDKALAFMETLTDDGLIEFSDGGERISCGAASLFRRLIASYPPMVAFGALATGENDPLGDAAATRQYTPPAGYSVSERGANLYHRAAAYQAKHGCSYKDAVLAVGDNS